MKITIEPTEELYEAPINGVNVPVRIWRGTSDNGAIIEAYVLTVVPETDKDAALFRSALPFFMVKSSKMYQIADFPKDQMDG